METGALAVAGVLIDWQTVHSQISVDEVVASQEVVEEDFAAEGQLDLSVGGIQGKSPVEEKTGALLLKMSSVVEQLVHFWEPGRQSR